MGFKPRTLGLLHQSEMYSTEAKLQQAFNTGQQDNVTLHPHRSSALIQVEMTKISDPQNPTLNKSMTFQ